MSQPYVNPDGVAFGACNYCGYCERFGCEVNAKASAHFTVIPLAARKNNVEMRTNARVMKVNLDTAKTRAESVTYINAAGREFEQPGENSATHRAPSTIANVSGTGRAKSRPHHLQFSPKKIRSEPACRIPPSRRAPSDGRGDRDPLAARSAP
jgi:choline dehydrogenase-like flavoprotein